MPNAIQSLLSGMNPAVARRLSAIRIDAGRVELLDLRRRLRGEPRRPPARAQRPTVQIPACTMSELVFGRSA